MANPPRKKGTGGETELLGILREDAPTLARTAASSVIDLQRLGPDPINVLATRPDNGQWLMTTNLDDFRRLLSGKVVLEVGLNIEVKRYKKFSLHTIFEGKFGRKKRG